MKILNIALLFSQPIFLLKSCSRAANLLHPIFFAFFPSISVQSIVRKPYAVNSDSIIEFTWRIYLLSCLGTNSIFELIFQIILLPLEDFIRHHCGNMCVKVGFLAFCMVEGKSIFLKYWHPWHACRKMIFYGTSCDLTLSRNRYSLQLVSIGCLIYCSLLVVIIG